LVGEAPQLNRHRLEELRSLVHPPDLLDLVGEVKHPHLLLDEFVLDPLVDPLLALLHLHLVVSFLGFARAYPPLFSMHTMP
jgi:hypothetical protein